MHFRFWASKEDSRAYAHKALITGSGGRWFQDDRNFLIFDESVEILRRFPDVIYSADLRKWDFEILRSAKNFQNSNFSLIFLRWIYVPVTGPADPGGGNIAKVVIVSIIYTIQTNHLILAKVGILEIIWNILIVCEIETIRLCCLISWKVSGYIPVTENRLI